MKREINYAVIKYSDIGSLPPEDHQTLIDLLTKVAQSRVAAGKPPLECVVVEKDWPEYYPTWKAIEDRLEGKFGFTLVEVERLQKSPEAVNIAMDIHDCWISEGEAMGFCTEGNQARKDVLRIERDRLLAEM